jgi:O-succinylbenzoate synthase
VIVERAVVRLIEMPSIRGFRTSFGAMERKTGVIVELRTEDGRTGYGECAAGPAPTYTEETAYSALQTLVRDLVPAAVGVDLRSPEALSARYAHVRGNRFAKAGLETAFWDLLSQERGAPLTDLLGGVRSHVEVGESLGIKDSMAELMDEVKLRLDEGYRRIKLKIRPGWDVEPTAAVRDAYPDIALTVDANAAYTLASTPVFRTLDRFELQMIEQPLAWDDLVDHATLQSQIATPVCLDESVRSAEDARRAIQLGSCRVVNIKTGRVGGVAEAKRIHDVCLAAGVPVWMGGMFETGIGRAFNIALASLADFTLPADMSPALMYFPEDLVEPGFVVEDGRVEVSRAIGLGYPVIEERVARLATEEVTVRA